MENYIDDLNCLKKEVQLLNQIKALIYQNIDDGEITTDLLNLIDEYSKQNKKFFTEEQLDLMHKSFRPLSEEEKSEGHTIEICDNCEWWGSSYLTSLEVDNENLICPYCGSETREFTDYIEYLSSDEDIIQALKTLTSECGYWEPNGTWKHLNPNPETVMNSRKIIENIS